MYINYILNFLYYLNEIQKYFDIKQFPSISSPVFLIILFKSSISFKFENSVKQYFSFFIHFII